MPEPFVFESMRPLVDANLKHRKRKLMQLLDRDVIHWGAHLRKLSYVPNMLENVYVTGMDKLPPREKPAPIMAFSHKKIQDVWAMGEFFLARPVEKFHDITVIIQAGVHSGIYPWRDLFPDFLKARLVRRPALYAANALGNRIAAFFRAVHTKPVYREGLDVPADKEAYDRELADGLLMGMDFDKFKVFANRTTMQSVVEIQKEMTGRNACLIIAPEGRYRMDGSVGEIQNFLGMVAFRKEREAHLLSLSYDELCSDRLGRIDAFIHVSDPVPPPGSKRKIEAYLERSREILQTNTIATASHLISATLREWHAASRPFSREDLGRGLTDRVGELRALGAPMDPRLTSPDHRQERLNRFWRKHRRRWLKREGKSYLVSAEKIGKFNDEERTVHDIQWNCNNLVHLPGIAGPAEKPHKSWRSWLPGNQEKNVSRG